MATVRYSIIRRNDRSNLIVRWISPTTETWRERSLRGVTRRRDAERLAQSVILDAERAGTFGLNEIDWDTFRCKYETEKLPLIKRPGIWNTAADRFEEAVAPMQLAKITAASFRQFESAIRLRGLAEETARSYIKTIRASLSWAAEIGLISSVPPFRLSPRKRKKRMKGRPITVDEFRKLADEAEKIEPSLLPLLDGLWYSGLRLGEALDLWWDRLDKIGVDNLDGRRPVLRIPGLQKSGEDSLYPMAPDFVEHLRRFPKQRRIGPVYRVLGRRFHGIGRSRYFNHNSDYVGRLIADAGRAADIVVDISPTGKVKWASAHDLRRSFGDRWSQRLMPAILMELMRHQSIETTMSYYVGRSAEQTADVVWLAYEAALVSSSAESAGQ